MKAFHNLVHVGLYHFAFYLVVLFCFIIAKQTHDNEARLRQFSSRSKTCDHMNQLSAE